MDSTQQKIKCGTYEHQCQLRLVNFEDHENHISHETQGLSKKHLVVRRGKPFKLTLLFGSQSWNPHTEILGLEVWIGDMYEAIQVQFSDERSDPHAWSAKIYPGDIHSQSVTLHICSPVLSAVGLYNLLVHIETRHNKRTYAVGTFVLLCNPWLKEDPVYMPLEVQTEEYIKSDYGMLYMGSHLNISSRPWSFGQYEPGVLEACLQLLQVSPQHLNNKRKDYIQRADPVYLSRVVCAMVNCNDDLGILEGKWNGSYKDGVHPTEWSGSADILHQWVSSNCCPVRYGQCWVFASVLCTVMRVLGIPSRVVTVFNAAHDTDGTLAIEEYYSSSGDKLNLSNDSVWNFHVWVECWMRRPDLGLGFDGWQVVDPTPQEKSAGIYCCGPCPVAAIQQHCLKARFDTPFVCASVDADIVKLIVRNGQVVGKTVDSNHVGQLICTKSINSDKKEILTQAYKPKKIKDPPMDSSYRNFCQSSTMMGRSMEGMIHGCIGGSEPTADSSSSYCFQSATMMGRSGETSPGLEVSLNLDGVPIIGNSIAVCVKVTNQSNSPRVLMEHVNAQVKEYNRNPMESFWKEHKEVHIQPGQVLKLNHSISPSEYESVLGSEDIVNMAVVIKDMRTKERLLATQEFSLSSPEITVEVEGGDSIQMKKKHTARVSFTNTLHKTLNGVVLTVEGKGLLEGKQTVKMVLLQPGGKIEKTVSIMANSPGTKVLMATFSHSSSDKVVSRSFHKVSIVT